MPIYEYRCNSCNIQFELRQKFSDPPADKCHKCGGAVRKMVSAASFSLKGSGWYGDGYGDKTEPAAKSEGDASVVESEAKTEEAGATTEGASTETTPAKSSASPATQASAPPTQMETKSTTAEAPTTTRDKAEVKAQGDNSTSIP